MPFLSGAPLLRKILDQPLMLFAVCLLHVLTLLQDEVEEEIEEDDSYLDLAGMKQQSQMHVSISFIFICTSTQSTIRHQNIHCHFILNQ